MNLYKDLEKYQTIGARFWALIIDSFVLAIFFGILSVVVFSAFPAGTDPALSTYIVNVLISLASAFYYILMHFYFGQTLGKMATRVRVLEAASEKKITLGQAIIRQLPQLIPVIILIGVFNAQTGYVATLEVVSTIFYLVWNLADIIVCLSNEKHRALHDYIAGTIVVKSNL